MTDIEPKRGSINGASSPTGIAVVIEPGDPFAKDQRSTGIVGEFGRWRQAWKHVPISHRSMGGQFCRLHCGIGRLTSFGIDDQNAMPFGRKMLLPHASMA
jgi:hypothetical protein